MAIRLSLAGFEVRGAGVGKRIRQEGACESGDDDRSIGIEVGGMELSFGKIVQPSPASAAVSGYIDTGDRGEDLAVVPGWIDF